MITKSGEAGARTRLVVGHARLEDGARDVEGGLARETVRESLTGIHLRGSGQTKGDGWGSV